MPNQQIKTGISINPNRKDKKIDNFTTETHPVERGGEERRER